MATRFLLLALSAASMTAAAPSLSATPVSPFSGAAAQTATLPNGGIVNARYLENAKREAGRKIVDVGDGIWVIRNYSIVNCVIVETDAGLVVFDTGTNAAEGEQFANIIRSRSQKPVIAIVYSHNHYTGGAGAIADALGSSDMLVIGHPKLETNLASHSIELKRAFERRLNLQFGAFLPDSGPDARLSPPIVVSDDPAKLAEHHLAVSRPVTDGETLMIGGTEFIFYHAEGDTDDTLTAWIPSRSAVVTNVIARQFFAMYTLRGARFRDPQGIIDGYAQIRDLTPEHYVPVHGDPVSGREAVRARMESHRDAYAFAYNQAVRAINNGWSPDELAEKIQLPERLRNDPTLFEGYSEFVFALRGIYGGLIGWFAEDTADLHPPSPERLGQSVVAGFGGEASLLAAAREAQAARQFDLAAKLASFAVDASPASTDARLVKATALRSMAQVSTGLQARNFYLSQALELEGKIDTHVPQAALFGAINFDTIKNAPAISLVKVLESRIIPERAADRTEAFDVGFTDGGTRYSVMIRNGVAEVTPAKSTSAHPAILIDRKNWFAVLDRKANLKDLIAQNKAKLEHADMRRMETLLAMFDPL